MIGIPHRFELVGTECNFSSIFTKVRLAKKKVLFDINTSINTSYQSRVKRSHYNLTHINKLHCFTSPPAHNIWS